MSYDDQGLPGCDWPGCVRQFDAASGPAEPGWVRYAKRFWTGLLLCPQHAPTEHLPTTVRRDGELLVVCGCGEVLGFDPTSGLVARRWWEVHVAEVLDLPSMSLPAYASSVQVAKARAERRKPRYHRRDCNHLRRNPERVIAISESERAGYQPCAACIGGAGQEGAPG